MRRWRWWEVVATCVGVVGILPLLFWWAILPFGAWYQSHPGSSEPALPWLVAALAVTTLAIVLPLLAARRWPRVRRSAWLSLSLPLALVAFGAESWLVRPIDAPDFPTANWPDAIEQVDDVTVTRSEGARELQRPHETHHLLLSVRGAEGMTDACGQVVAAIHEAGWDHVRWARPNRGCRQSGDAPDGGSFSVESLEDMPTLLDLATLRRFRTHERDDRHQVVVVVRGEHRL